MTLQDEISALREELCHTRKEITCLREDNAQLRETLARHSERFKHPCEKHEEMVARIGTIEGNQRGLLTGLKTWLPVLFTVIGWIVIFLLERSHLPGQ